MTQETTPTPLSYRDAGVDVQAADHFVERIAGLARSTHEGVDVVNKTAYAGLVRPDLTGMDSPLIAATCDGVGTKLLVAKEANHFSGLGQDLVKRFAGNCITCSLVRLVAASAATEQNSHAG